MERVEVNGRNPFRKKAHLSDNLCTGLWPDSGKRRMLLIQTPFSPSAPHLSLAVLYKVVFLCLFPEQNGTNPEF